MEENPDKVFTFPIQFIHSPYLKDLTSSAMGCYVRLICDYWLTGYPLPVTDNKLNLKAQVNRAVWSRVKNEVLQALRVTMPKIIKERKKRREVYLVRLETNRLGRAALIKWNEERTREKRDPITDSIQQPMITQPNRKLPFPGDGRSDEHKLREVRQRLKVKKPLGAKMFDKPTN